MKRALTACLAVATVAVVFAASVTDADAQRRRYRGPSGGAVAAGIIGGIAAGAIIAGASRPAYAYPTYYRPLPGYVAYDGYYAAAPYGCHGYWARRPVRDRWGNVVGWSRPRYFCY